MTERLASLAAVAGRFDAIVFDQWGVLHDGGAPYPRAVAAVAALRAAGPLLAVLSNSGKRAAPNAARIAAMGFDVSAFAAVMTSGEALWRDIAGGKVAARRLAPIERAPGDAAAWAEGLDVTLTDDVETAEAVLLMGLPDDLDGPGAERCAALLDAALQRRAPVFCTNPDRASPRPGGVQVMSPGALAHRHAERGGSVRFYGKPHLPVFRALQAALGAPPDRILMVGDSLEHDIAGAQAAGWRSAFVEAGLHAAAFAGAASPEAALDRLIAAEAAPRPDFTLRELC